MGRSPYTTYKAFGGILVALTLPAAILIVLRDTPVGGGPPLPLAAGILPAMLAAVGLYIFIASDRKIREAQDQATKDNIQHGPSIDWKGVLIAAAALLFYLILIGLQAAGVI